MYNGATVVNKLAQLADFEYFRNPSAREADSSSV
jgi:hypothetical protein